MKTPPVSYKTAHVNGFKVFYREAGDAKAPRRSFCFMASRLRATCSAT
jgi:hypothetical protein